MGGKKKEGRVPIWARQSEPLVIVKPRAVLWKFAFIALAAGGLIAGGIAISRRLDWWPFAERLRTFAGLAGSWSPLLSSLLLVGIVVILVLWKLPALQVARSRALTDEKRFDRENEARKTLAQILAGVFVLAGLYSSVQTFNLSREGQITDRFTKAIEQLGALDGTGQPKLEVRLGGIYALERIARDSERDHWAIMDVLTTYVREHSPEKRGDQKTQETTRTPKTPVNAQEEKTRVGADIQAILTVLARRESRYDKGPLDLSNIEVHGAILRRANLSSANLNGANLNGANLSWAGLNGANFSRAFLTAANLRNANLTRAILSKAWLFEADLSAADLSGANLSGADLSRANLTGADLSGAKDLIQEQIESTYGDAQTKLPSSLKKPNDWLK
jgi:hypothetical protein